MRLHNLAMSYIGPYVGRVSIDFASLGDVFLVCGKTGSGKSTLFEAIAYALYGSERGARELVSHYAGPEDESYVELEFKAGQQPWRITRKPARTVAKKRGTGTTERPSEVALWKRDASGWKAVSDKATEVDATIERIIGLSFDEFTKIVLLPQGEFQRFLEMSTNDRTAILEKLFPVDLHGAVSDLAREKAKEAENRARDMDERIRALEARLGDEPEAAAELARSALGSARIDEAAAFSSLDEAKAAARAAELALRTFAELDTATASMLAISSTAAEAASLAARLERAEAAIAARHAVEAARRARLVHTEAAKELEAANGTLATLDSLAPQIDAERTGLAETLSALVGMDTEAGRLSALASAWERASAARSRLENTRRLLAAVESGKARSVTAYGEATAVLAGLESIPADAETLEAERAAATEALESARAAMRRAQEAESHQQALAELRSRLEAERGRTGNAAGEQAGSAAALSSAESAFEAARSRSFAHQLARTLENGRPCPVCGSTEHPDPAVPGDGAAGIGSLEALERSLAEAKAAARLADDEAAACGARLSELGQALSGMEGRAAAFADAQTIQAALLDCDVAEMRLSAANDAIAAESARIKAAATARGSVDKLRGLLDAATSAESLARADFAAAEASAQEADSGSGGSDPGPLVARLNEKKKAAAADKERREALIASWEADRGAAVARASETYRRHESAFADLAVYNTGMAKALADARFDGEEAWSAATMPNDELAAARSQAKERADEEASAGARLAAAERAAAGLARPDAAATGAGLASASAAYAAARSALDEAVRVEHDLAAALATLEAERAERAARRERGERLVAMSRLLNGDTDGRRLSFKNFALASYFAAVVEHASMRLREMSDSRYDMRVTESKMAGKSRIGLDLEVLDAFTGVARPASSLSGGEKFLASISLALGLSDVIVARAGGINLDSIFIDEGFGSLDDETLDRAMTALDRVRGERVIGIVSHVADLRGRVPVRIEVLKSSAGSTLRVVR
jgi:DNA repair protein SbcC/Rad50